MKRKSFLFGIASLFLIYLPVIAQTWTASKRLTWNSGQSLWPRVVADSGNRIHVVWADNSSGTREIYYKRSTDGGTTWAGQRRLTWNTGSSDYPVIAVDSNDHLHVLWCEYTPGNPEIFYKRSTDGGENWTGVKRLTWNLTGSYEPAIAVDSNDALHVVWFDGSTGNFDVYHKKSSDGGSSWTGAKRLTWNLGESRSPSIAVDSADDLHVTWHDSSGGPWQIFYKHSTDGGTTWTGQKKLTWNSGLSEYPFIAADTNDHLHVVWFDGTPGNYEVYYRKSTDGGADWNTINRLTWNSGDSIPRMMAIDTNNHLHVIWDDKTPGNWQIYYKKSTNGGATWSSFKRLTWDTAESRSPSITSDSSDSLHVVWVDSAPLNQEIFYKKGIQ